MRGSLWMAFALACVACSLDQSPGSGGLAVLVDSDMAVPKDIDQITVDVTQSGKSIKHDEQQFTEGRVGLPWEVRVPRTDDHSPATIRVVAFKEGRTRIVREAITTIPTAYLGVLRMGVDYLCDGMVDDSGQSTCGLDQTCVQGTCAPATLTMDPAPYGALDMTTFAAVRSADAGVDQCFNISSCFSEATEESPDANCAFVPPSLFGDHLNVALRLDLGSPGVCDDTACWIVLDSGPDGWRIVNGQVVLPANICQRRSQGSNLRVAVTQRCSPKTEVMPSCPSGTPAVTIPGQNTPITSVATAQGVLPAVGDACSGAGTKSCEMCGKSDRMCQNGLWSTYGECTNQGECEPNVTQACGAMGMRTCGGDCTWSRCDSQRCEGAATRACGNCGTQHRECDNGVWAEWSPCEAEGECMPNATEACGVGGTRACGGNCTWGPCGMQQCPGAPSQACGNCGMQMRTCDGGTATWSAWGLCEGEGVCMPNATQTCGMNGTQTCGGKCQWDVGCTGQTCPGAAAEACGNCGTRMRVCDMNTGEWSPWSDCLGQGVCAPDTTRVCGANQTGTQSCAGNCQWDDACTGQKCVGAAVEGCGLCGTRSRTCNTGNGTWSDWTPCSNEGDCSPNTTRTCGSGGTQTCTAQCKWPAACPGQMCTGSATSGCNMCGAKTCNTNTGTWSTTCAGQGVCTAGTTAQRTCATGSHQSCGATCQWDNVCTCNGTLTSCTVNGAATCVDTAADSNNCGKCGNVCTGGMTCTNGVCGCTGNGQVSCGGVCTNINKDGNCGACGNTCSGGKQCNGASCVCPAGQVDCSGICKNVLGSDPTNCGGCGRQCAGGQSCVMGQCMLVCGGAAPDKCGNSCTNTKSDGANCGACGNVCAPGQSCTDGVCCATSSKVCGGTCINTNSDPANCGKCNNVCPSGTMCSSGDCMVVCGGNTPDMCSANACTNVQTDEKNCGACGSACAPGQTCTDGKCCGSGQILCSGQCTSTSSDSANCGACGKVCSSGLTCVAGKCSLVCGGETPNACSGVCTNTQSDHDNCGSCGMLCGTTEMCVGGKCTLVCGGNSPDMCNGACANTKTDHNNCGGCGMTCGATQTCSNGSCVCGAGLLKCGSACVDSMSDDSNCGACGNACGAGQACMMGVCGVVCGANTPNACGNTCTNLKNDEKNCGACGNACGPGDTCQNGTCTLVCTGATMKCGNACVDVTSDPTNCGACGMACESGMCSKGQCVPVCSGSAPNLCGATCTNFQNDKNNCGMCGKTCDGACSAGQCVPVCSGSTPDLCGNTCTNVQSDKKNCGVCGNACDGACSAGQCVPVCSGATPNQCGNACTNFQTDKNNCGMCGKACDGACTDGQCAPVCSGLTPNMCGNTCVNLQTDSENCGACSKPCGGAKSECSGGKCGCPSGTMDCGDGTCLAQCPCAAGTHRCGSSCEKISNNSCTAACTPCPTVSNGSSTCNASTDQCETKCAAVECLGACCKPGQTCELTGCADPAPPPPPQAGSSGTPQTTGGKGTGKPDGGTKMFDGGPIIENSAPPR